MASPYHPYGLCASSNFRPALDTKRKSRLLSSCLQSVLALPLMDVLEKHLCLFMDPPNIQVSQGDQEDMGEGVRRGISAGQKVLWSSGL